MPNVWSYLTTPCHSLSYLITPYSLGWKKKPFSFGNFKISSQAPNFLSHLITPCHSFSHLIRAFSRGWKQNHFYMATLKLVSRPQFFYQILSRLAIPYHTLSHVILLFTNFKIISQVPNFLSHLIMPCHSFRAYHILSPSLETKQLSFGNFRISCQAPNFWSHLIAPCLSL